MRFLCHQGTPSAFPGETFRISVKPEFRKIKFVTKEHEQAYYKQKRTKNEFTPCPDSLLNAEHAGTFFQNHNQYHSEQGV